MENPRTATDVRRELARFEDDAWSFGTLMTVVAACFVLLGGMIYLFAEYEGQQAAQMTPLRTERSIKTTPPSPPTTAPNTIGQGGSP
jgi:hypothetical protein